MLTFLLVEHMRFLHQIGTWLRNSSHMNISNRRKYQQMLIFIAIFIFPSPEREVLFEADFIYDSMSCTFSNKKKIIRTEVQQFEISRPRSAKRSVRTLADIRSNEFPTKSVFFSLSSAKETCH